VEEKRVREVVLFAVRADQGDEFRGDMYLSRAEGDVEEGWGGRWGWRWGRWCAVC